MEKKSSSKFLLHDPQIVLTEWTEIGELNSVHISSIDDDVVEGTNRLLLWKLKVAD